MDISIHFSLFLDSGFNLNDGMLLTCQPTTWSHAHRFPKVVKSRTFSHVLVLNDSLLPTLQKFRSALTLYP